MYFIDIIPLLIADTIAKEWILYNYYTQNTLINV